MKRQSPGDAPSERKSRKMNGAQTQSVLPTFFTMSTELVAIRVGDPEIEFLVHKELMSSVSGYFCGASDGHFREASERTIPLADVTERTFRIFLQWAYSQMHVGQINNGKFGSEDPLPRSSETTETINHADTNSNTSFEKTENDWIFDEAVLIDSNDLDEDKMNQMYWKNEKWLTEYNHGVMSLLALYIFADKYCVDQLRDDIISALFGHCVAWNWWIEPEHQIVDMAYENLPSSAKFIQVLVVSWCQNFTPSETRTSLLESLRDVHPGFLFDVMMQHAQLKEEEAESDKHSSDEDDDYDDKLRNSCLFHEHLLYSERDCRKRLAKNLHIFTGLIDACMNNNGSSSQGNVSEHLGNVGID